MSSANRLAVAAMVATLLGMLTLLPVIETGAWVIPTALLVGLIAGTGILARRWRVPRVLIPVLQVLVTLLWIGLFVAGDVSFLGLIPTWSWFERIFTVVGEGLDATNRYAAPVPLERGIFAMLLGGIGLVAVLVDLLAVTLRRVVLAGLPLLSIYAVSASVVSGGVSWVLFVPVAAGFLVLLVADRRHFVAHWGRAVTLSDRHVDGEPRAASLARNGRRLGAAAIVAAVLVPAVLPGLPESVFTTGGGSGGGVIRTNNPIVDMKRDLVRPDNVEVFRYRTADANPEYIRVATLDAFDGKLWHQSARPVPRSHRVSRGLPDPPGLSSSVPRESITTEFTISDNFKSTWLPMPYPPHEVRIDGDWRYDTGTLDVVGIGRDTSGTEYVVESYEVDIDAVDLRGAGAAPDPVQKYTALPEDLPEAVEGIAREVTAEATNNFERAAALQRWFRSTGGFTYDLSVHPGNSSTALRDFLRDKHGYCEQFAAAMAIMARSLGIPARVATGYLPGSNVSGNTWVVRAHDAHAWPELYFEGVGWTRFEPTPASRAAAPSWSIPPTTTEETSAGPTAQPSVAPGGDAQAPAEQDRLDELSGSLGQGQDGGGFPWQSVLGGVAVLLVLVMPAGSAWARRRLRWRGAEGDVARQVEAAWADLREAVRDAGLTWDAAETPRWTGQRLVEEAALSQDGKDLLEHIVRTTETARYARRVEPVEKLREDSSILRRAILAGRPVHRRIRAFLLPSGAGDVMTSAASRVADGLDWTDTAGERLRTAARERFRSREKVK